MPFQEEFEKQSIWLFKYGKGLPQIVLVVGYLVLLNSEIYPEGLFLRKSTYESLFEIVCLSLSMIGFVFRIITIGYSERPKKEDSRGLFINQHYNAGAYSVVRHPLYLADFIIWLGMIAITGNFWFIVSFGLLFFLYMERMMVAKEMQLKNKFGFKYTRWAEHIPAFLPDIWQFRKSKSEFNWDKIVKGESGRLSRILIIFFVFEISCHYLENKKNYNFTLLIASTIFAIAHVIYNKKEMIANVRRWIVRLQ
ncbi:methyltransferase family protein [Flavobacterium noncentrifugens]|uniref:Protein-S-isoprenylcysteine O-methyltransferase Ste14 n=1 Tax=Flavobacterium noncentrifugens TaxID=1128970 RepID=A0A1G8ZKS9_9FLAO|nr:isoprenylcysteine carboxylmethyltransferase family protein [Flavobacterium noncentrifugens]SDK15641.1 Protein-S-isoprenylcysteine O-methyltransferase Ste14 [Flavobacterium noncentrifugens]